jgi:hypothetical protein
MDKKPTEPAPIANAADYVDALIRPRPDAPKVTRRIIGGRRMRDKYLEQILVTDVVKRSN